MTALPAATPIHKPRITVERIGPKEARKLLGENTHNRHISELRVETLKRAMLRGDFDGLNGETIKLATTGALLDGQHRLLAIIASDTTIDLIVVRGLPAVAQETIDLGARRSPSDILHLRGEMSATTLAAALRVAWSIDTNGSLFAGSTIPRATVAELTDYLDTHPDIRSSVSMGRRANNAAIRYPAGPATGLHYLMAQASEQAESFWEGLIEGVELEAGSPTLVFRNMLLRDVTEQRRMRTEVRSALTIKAWNALRQGRKIESLAWRRSGPSPEPWPAIE